MEIIELSKENYKSYENFLLTFDESLVYYSSNYKELLEDYLNVESKYLLAVDNGDIKGVLPLMKKEGKYGIVLNSLPFYGSNGGILSRDKEAINLLVEYYNNLSKDVASSTYITNPLKDNSFDIKCDIVDDRVGQWTYIGYKEDIDSSLMQSFHSKTRNIIRKAIKEGIEVEIDNSQIDFLYETHYENMLSVGAKPKGKRFFELINRYFNEDEYSIYIARKDGKIISALLLFFYNKTVEYFTPAILKDYRHFHSNSLIIYKSMIDAAKRGFKWWNWGGTYRSLDGVYRFKKRFGAIDKRYHFLLRINNLELYNSTKDELIKEYEDFFVIPFDKLSTK